MFLPPNRFTPSGKSSLSGLPTSKRGFALIASLAIMAVLVMIAVALYSMSNVATRTATLAKARTEAQANAKMALMKAIGELQAELGPDQRISANAAILDTTPESHVVEGIANPHWLGVWDSWIAGPVNPDTVNPNYPRTRFSQSHHQTIGDQPHDSMRPFYNQKDDYFRRWLVSLDPSTIDSGDLNIAGNLNLAGEPTPQNSSSAVILVGEGSLGSNAESEQHVSAGLLGILDDGSNQMRGRYAWWIGDQSQKAQIIEDSYETQLSPTDAEQIFRAQAPASMGTKTISEFAQMSADEEMQLEKLGFFIEGLDLIKIGGNPVSGDPSKTFTLAGEEKLSFHNLTLSSFGILADVREGGLKRDLSTLLERPISISERGDEFMLYRFYTKDGLMGTTKPQEIVPIQDLAAYYQLYDAVSPEAESIDPSRISSERGVQYSSADMPNGMTSGMHITSVDYGTTSDSPIYPREYTALYRQPKIIKVQFLLSLFSEIIDPPLPAGRGQTPNTHELIIGVTPSITLWNPTNLPIIMQMRNNPELVTQMMRFGNTPLQLKIIKNEGESDEFESNYTSLAGLNGTNDSFNLYWSGVYPVHLEPGEVKTLSLPYSGDLKDLKDQLGYSGHWANWNNNFFMKTDTYFLGHEAKIGWEPESFILMNNSASPNDGGDPPLPGMPDNRNIVDGRLRFKATDMLQIKVGSGGGDNLVSYMVNQSSYQDYNTNTSFWDRRNTQMNSRKKAGNEFNEALFARGMTDPTAENELISASRRGASIIARSATDTGWPFLQYSFQAGVETSETYNSGISAGRKFASRPFLHSSPLHSSPFLDDDTGNALYNFGWNWSVDLINDVYEAPIQVTEEGQGYYGGGYTSESGSTHVIQQEIPVVPPLSIASLSSARLGGWSMSDQEAMEYAELQAAGSTTKHQLLRAVGFGGLYPYTLQAIGNSYAHPQIPADQAFTTISRVFSEDDGSVNVTMADHSYLANKALWDEYFFSSITRQPNAVEVFGSADRTVEEVAEDFFFEDKPLPNRRIKPYAANITPQKLDGLMTQKTDFFDGLADKIAAHLLVEGPFNINSTSYEAWKVFFSSLKAKSVAYLESDAAMSGNGPSVSTSHDGTPVSQTGLAGGAPFTGSPDSPNSPEQWTSWRALTDTEIDQLAKAMVSQVKLRGPFLSLSEFVNRRLEGDSTADAAERSVKGALQAALDDHPRVTINSAFREDNRKFSDDEISTMDPEFDLAAEGPVAYGSTAYVDQADLLRSFAAQLTPRGDTFVIRTYGDALDSQGNVEARAWCEAVVQRVPDYVDPSADQSHTKQSLLSSELNKTFGRQFKIISFRWLDASEV